MEILQDKLFIAIKFELLKKYQSQNTSKTLKNQCTCKLATPYFGDTRWFIDNIQVGFKFVVIDKRQTDMQRLTCYGKCVKIITVKRKI